MNDNLSCRIRPATLADRDIIDDIAQKAFSCYLPRMDRKPFPMLDDYAFHISEGRVHILEENYAIVGYLVLVIDTKNEIWLDTIGILPDKQGKGYGRVLIEYAENCAREQGFKHIRLYTNEAMHENISLYLHLGYEVTHNTMQHGYNRVFLWKNLAACSL